MKKVLILTAILVALSSGINAQTFGVKSKKTKSSENFSDCKICQKPILYQFAGGWGSEKWGGSFTVHVNDASYREIVYAGIEITQLSQIGIIAGTERVELFSKGGKFSIKLNNAIEWQYRLKVVTSHNSLVDETFRNTQRMIISYRVGPSFYLGRFGFGLYMNGGISFLPQRSSDGRWYWGGFGQLSYRFGNKNK